MKKWKQGVIAAALLIGAALPVSGYAADGSALAKEHTVSGSAISEKAQSDRGGHHSFRKRMTAHQNMYMTLLAEKYTPDDLEEWKEVLKERDRLIAEVREARAASGKSREWLAKREERRELKEQLKAKVEKGEMTVEQMKQKLQEWKEKNFPGKTADEAKRQAQMEKFRAVHEEFDAAIESGEAARIKAVLPKLLEEMKAKNERLAEKLKELKK